MTNELRSAWEEMMQSILAASDKMEQTINNLDQPISKSGYTVVVGTNDEGEETIADALQDIQDAGNQPDDVFERMERHEVTSALACLPDDKLADLVRLYLFDSIHNNWDGHMEDDVDSYYVLFRDMLRYRDNNRGKPTLINR